MKREVASRTGSVRKRFHRPLTVLPNTFGTAVGYKRTAGRKTRRPAVVVYVREKVPLESLVPETTVPKHVTYRGNRVATDVCPVGTLAYQLGPPPWFCLDRTDNQGTVTTLCRTSAGEVIGLTCAHCIEGYDRDPSTPDDISLWDPVRRDYFLIGKTGPYAATTGFGLANNFGFSDWGLFSVDDEVLQAVGLEAEPLKLGPNRIGTAVIARTAHGLIQGVVEYHQIQLGSLYADVAIRVEEGGTFPGDSGVLWRDTRGRAVAIHAIGERDPTGSRISFAMFAERIAADLIAVGVEPLDC